MLLLPPAPGVSRDSTGGRARAGAQREPGVCSGFRIWKAELRPLFVFLGPDSRATKSCNTVYSDIPPELRALIEPIVEDHGCELVDVEVRRGRPPWLVRITIDTPQGDGRVPIDRCADVSREVGTQLDAEDAIERTYRLEVSSPGLNRVLARERDFAAARGCEVSVETRRPLDGRRRFRGRLESFDGAVARMLVDGSSFAIPFDEVARAHRVYDVTAADFARPKR